MHPTRFDALAAEFAQRGSRRYVLGILGSSLAITLARLGLGVPGAAGHLAQACPPDQACGPTCCPAGQSCIYGPHNGPPTGECCPDQQNCHDVCCPPENQGCNYLPGDETASCFCGDGLVWHRDDNVCAACSWSLDCGIGQTCCNGRCCDNCCHGQCCSNFEECIDGNCAAPPPPCPDGCPDGEICLIDGCCPSARVCGSACCDGACCPPAPGQSGPSVCCAPGDTCARHDPAHHFCAPNCTGDGQPACPPGQQCCAGTCCPAQTICCDGHGRCGRQLRDCNEEGECPTSASECQGGRCCSSSDGETVCQITSHPTTAHRVCAPCGGMNQPACLDGTCGPGLHACLAATGNVCTSCNCCDNGFYLNPGTCACYCGVECSPPKVQFGCYCLEPCYPPDPDCTPGSIDAVRGCYC